VIYSYRLYIHDVYRVFGTILYVSRVIKFLYISLPMDCYFGTKFFTFFYSYKNIARKIIKIREIFYTQIVSVSIRF